MWGVICDDCRTLEPATRPYSRGEPRRVAGVAATWGTRKASWASRTVAGAVVLQGVGIASDEGVVQLAAS